MQNEIILLLSIKKILVYPQQTYVSTFSVFSIFIFGLNLQKNVLKVIMHNKRKTLFSIVH